jgi:type IV secretory pathway VirB2 component (pilin)
MLKILTGYRKFTMAIVFLLVAVLLLTAGIVPSDDWLKHVSSVMIAFMATNVGEHIISVGKEWVNEKFKK